ncbi:MAG: hypothetical protein H7Y37_12480 [Anaerolineae bacterium]|nr:hypothetical protein [Gloeobacterales cyanobacterium ES-bin-313]
MNAESQTLLVAAYIDRLVAFHVQQQRWLSLEEMRQVSQEFGLSEGDITVADCEGRRLREKGLVHCHYRQWDEAIVDLTVAVSVDPLSVEGLHGLARAYQGRWSTQRKPEDLQESRRLSRRCLQIDPNHKASVILLSQLRTERKVLVSTGIIAAGIGVLLLLLSRFKG